jgi:S-adenosylmethionine hydrolase
VAGKLLGEVVSIDASGNLITDITEGQLEGIPRDESVSVACDGHKTFGIFSADQQQPEMTLLAVLNVDGRLAISLVGESAESFLGIRTGSAVVVSW